MQIFIDTVMTDPWLQIQWLGGGPKTPLASGTHAVQLQAQVIFKSWGLGEQASAARQKSLFPLSQETGSVCVLGDGESGP